MQKAKRKIIMIDEKKCTGCGACITGCAEGALQLVDGKAKVVKEQYCDGFGDCIGQCPTGALQIVEREADGFDMQATRQHVLQQGGGAALHRLEAAHARHGQAVPQPGQVHGGGCPGSRLRVFTEESRPAVPTAGGGPAHAISSELRQWPIQIHLVPPDATFFKGKELVVMSTCGPLASADVHWRFLRGRGVVVGCPKLDDTSGYTGKLSQILSEPSIPKVIVVRMEVPCCGGLTAIVKAAAAASGRSDLHVEEAILGVNGDLIEVRAMA